MKNLPITLLLLFAPAMAQAASMDTLTFRELSGEHLEQSKPVTLALLHGHPAVVTFWWPQCAPCQIELKALPEIARQHPDLSIALVSLQDSAPATQRLAEAGLPANVHVLIAEQDGKQVLAAFDDAMQILPFSASLHKDGSVCGRRNGILGPDIVSDWVKQC